MSFSMKRVPHRQDAMNHGEQRGLKTGALVALMLLFIWFLDMGPFNLTMTLVLMGAAVVLFRLYGSYACGKRWDFYEGERQLLMKSGLDSEQAFNLISQN